MDIRNHVTYVEPGTQIEGTWDDSRTLTLSHGHRPLGQCRADTHADALRLLDELGFVAVEAQELLGGFYSYTATKAY